MGDGVTRTRAGNLTAALVAVAFLELLLNRLANRLFSGGSARSLAARMLSDSGPFLFHLTGVLALLVLVVAFVGLLRRGELFSRSLGALAVAIGHMQPRFFLYLETAFAFLALLVAASVAGAPLKARVKI